jgi:hypothetical protein
VVIMGHAGSVAPTENWVACEVLTRVAMKHEFACHSSHRANNNFQLNNKAIELIYDSVIYSRGNKSYIIELCLRDFVML